MSYSIRILRVGTLFLIALLSVTGVGFAGEASGGSDRPVVVFAKFDAVSDKESSNADAARCAKAVEDSLLAGLTDGNQLTILERIDVGKIVQEQKLTGQPGFDADVYAHAGKAMHASAILIGRLRRVADVNTVSVRVINCSNSALVSATEADGSVEELVEKMPGISDEIKLAFTKQHILPVTTNGALHPAKALRFHERAEPKRTLRMP